jgi:ribosomal protein S18 acetylase RimI-like enzyme
MKMYFEEILQMIENISPHARDYVIREMKNNNVEILYCLEKEQNRGAFVKVDTPECCIFYASFLNESDIDPVVELIKDNIKDYILKTTPKEICFNIYGNNKKIIKLAKEIGFEVDMEGFHLQYMGRQLPQLNDCGLSVEEYKPNRLNEFVDLFDSAYYNLAKDNGWETNYNALNPDKLNQKLTCLNRHKQVVSFWIKDTLIGTYLFEKNYITDIVVRPQFQNKGYGSYMLAHCIKNMSINKNVENIRLRVSKSNVGAKKLYQTNGFIEMACFAEHTYRQSK